MNGTVPKCCRNERKEGEIPEYFWVSASSIFMLILKPLLPLLSFSFWGALRPFQELQAIGVSTSTYLLYLAPRWPAVCSVCRLLGDSTVLRAAVQHSASTRVKR